MQAIKIPNSVFDHYKYCSLTGLFTALKDISQRTKKGAVVPSFSNDRYKYITIEGRQYKAHRVAYFMHHKTQPKVVDHINHRKDCNRINNLRSVCTTINNRNKRDKLGHFERLRFRKKPTLSHLHRLTKKHSRKVVAGTLRISVFSLDKYLKLGHLKKDPQIKRAVELDTSFTVQNFINDRLRFHNVKI